MKTAADIIQEVRNIAASDPDRVYEGPSDENAWACSNIAGADQRYPLNVTSSQ